MGANKYKITNFHGLLENIKYRKAKFESNLMQSSIEVNCSNEEVSNKEKEGSTPVSSQCVESQPLKVATENSEIYGCTKVREPTVIPKRHRRHYRQRKTESRRYYNSSTANYNDGHQQFGNKVTNHKDNDVMVRNISLFHHSQRKQEYIKQKSASSIISLQHSSTTNSDIDNIHSSSISGSMPPSICTYQYKLPASISSTPQASYADITHRSITPTSSIYCDSLDGDKPSDVNKSPVNLLQETSNSANFQEKDFEKSSVFNPIQNIKSHQNYKLIDNENNDTEKDNEQLCFDGQQNHPPVIIMDNYQPAENDCGISFGIDLDEFLHLTNDNNMIAHSNEFTSEKAPNTSTTTEKSQEKESSESLECGSAHDGIEEIEKDTQQLFIANPSNEVLSKNNNLKQSRSSIISNSDIKLIVLKSGKKIYWKEPIQDKKGFTYDEIMQYNGAKVQENDDKFEMESRNIGKYLRRSCNQRSE